MMAMMTSLRIFGSNRPNIWNHPTLVKERVV
jgi:hypothetical protein